ncbi:MAG: lipoprotein-releasing ABC transporter permease subunit [Elusimicrobia bacterium]|nr:lipoprotein-releasing ABC transporter permease subunit [Elusimicrobiota bacterium]
MNFERFIALRYFWATRRKFFSALLTIISISGIAVGVMALVITLSVMNGFQSDIKEKILSLSPHITIYSDSEIPKEAINLPGIKNSSKFVYGQMILRKGRNASGVIVKGIIPDEEKNIISLEKTLRNRNINVLKEKTVFIGSELSKNLLISIGDKIILVSPFGETSAFGIIPRMEMFTVADIFESGMYEYDSTLVYLNMSDGKRLFGKDGIIGVGLKTDDLFKADEISQAIRKKLDFGYTVKSWGEMNKNLFSALKLEKFMMFLILTLIVVVATFNVISLLIVTTVEKIHSIGILKAIGTQSTSIMKIFLNLGFIIGIIGTTVGCVLGIFVSFILKRYKFIKLPADVYYIDRLPVKIVFSDILLIVVVSIIITLLAASYPAWKGSKIEPGEALRYE